MTTWLITGCSSGLGHALAEAVLKAGFNAVVTARDASKVKNLVSGYPDTALAAALDVTDPVSVAEICARAEARLGGGGCARQQCGLWLPRRRRGRRR